MKVKQVGITEYDDVPVVLSVTSIGKEENKEGLEAIKDHRYVPRGVGKDDPPPTPVNLTCLF